MILFGQKCLYSGKSGCIRANWLYSGKVVEFGYRGGIWAKVVVFGQIRMYSGKKGFFSGKSG